MVKKQSFDKIIVGTRVMEKAVAYPTDSRLLEGRQHLVKLATTLSIRWRQKCNWQAQCFALQVGRYAHARQFCRVKALFSSLRKLVGQRCRNVGRMLDRLNDTAAVRVRSHSGARQARVGLEAEGREQALQPARAESRMLQQGQSAPSLRVLRQSDGGDAQRRTDRWHAQHSGQFLPYDGHTLPEAVEQVRILADHPPTVVFVGQAYRGVDVASTTIWRSGQQRGVTPAIKKAILRCCAIKPLIGQ